MAVTSYANAFTGAAGVSQTRCAKTATISSASTVNFSTDFTNAASAVVNLSSSTLRMLWVANLGTDVLRVTIGGALFTVPGGATSIVEMVDTTNLTLSLAGTTVSAVVSAHYDSVST